MSLSPYPTPEFNIGDTVLYEVVAHKDGAEIRQKIAYIVVGIRLDANEEQRLCTYDLSRDPIAPWHYGSGVNVATVPARKLEKA